MVCAICILAYFVFGVRVLARVRPYNVLQTQYILDRGCRPPRVPALYNNITYSCVYTNNIKIMIRRTLHDLQFSHACFADQGRWGPRCRPLSQRFLGMRVKHRWPILLCFVKVFLYVPSNFLMVPFPPHDHCPIIFNITFLTFSSFTDNANLSFLSKLSKN